MNFSFYFDQHFLCIIPEIFLLLSTVNLIFFGCIVGFSKIKNFPLLNTVINNVLIFIFFCLFFLIINNPISNCIIFNGIFIIDEASFFVKLIIIISSICCLYISLYFIKIYQINNFEFFIIFLFSIFGLIILVSSIDFLLTYLILEIQSFCFYILAAFKKDSAYSTEAGLKYFLLGSFSSTILLFGISLIYASCGTTNFFLLSLLIFENNNFFLLGIFGFFLVFIGFLFKIAAAPFHIWSPDVYDGAPTNITIFFAVVPKISILIVFCRIFLIFSNNHNIFSNLFLISAVFSIIIGSFVTLKQKKIKKLIAYSAVNHVGYLLLGISLLTIESITSVFFYIFSYILTGLCFWSVLNFLLNVDKKNHNEFNIFNLNVLLKINPLLAFIFLSCVFSMAGIPPLVGFYAKLNIFQALINNGFIILACFIILMSVISTFYYIRLIKASFFENSKKNWFFFLKISKQHAVILVITFFLIFFLFINPFIFDLISYKLALSLFF